MTTNGYTLVIPPRWMHVPGGADLESVLPHDASSQDLALAAWASTFAAGLTESRAADPGRTVLDTYVHLGAFPGTEVGASITVARIDLEPGTAADVEQLLVLRGAREDAAVVDVGGVAGIVWTLSDHDAAELAEVAPDGRILARRNALVPAPGWTPEAPAVLTFLLTVVVPATVDETVIRAARPVAAAVEELFDAMLTTVRWTDPDGGIVAVPHEQTSARTSAPTTGASTTGGS